MDELLAYKNTVQPRKEKEQDWVYSYLQSCVQCLINLYKPATRRKKLTQMLNKMTRARELCAKTQGLLDRQALVFSLSDDNSQCRCLVLLWWKTSLTWLWDLLMALFLYIKEISHVTGTNSNNVIPFIWCKALIVVQYLFVVRKSWKKLQMPRVYIFVHQLLQYMPQRI